MRVPARIACSSSGWTQPKQEVTPSTEMFPEESCPQKGCDSALRLCAARSFTWLILLAVSGQAAQASLERLCCSAEPCGQGLANWGGRKAAAGSQGRWLSPRVSAGEALIHPRPLTCRFTTWRGSSSPCTLDQRACRQCSPRFLFYDVRLSLTK